MSKLLDNVVGELSRLPGIGRRTALRLAMHLLRLEEQDVVSMGESLIDFRTKICRCAKCNNLSDTEICDICTDASRDKSTVCVVEQVSDLLSIEKTHQYRGVYSVLGGVISPMQGIAPSDLRIDLLLDRIAMGEVKEVILALSSTMEGDTTNFYIYRKLQDTGVAVTVIARGVAQNDELQYTDEVTLGRALLGRTPYST